MQCSLQGTSVDELVELMDMGLSGKHISDLVSSGAQLSRVKNALEMVGGPNCAFGDRGQLGVLEGDVEGHWR